MYTTEKDGVPAELAAAQQPRYDVLQRNFAVHCSESCITIPFQVYCRSDGAELGVDLGDPMDCQISC